MNTKLILGITGGAVVILVIAFTLMLGIVTSQSRRPVDSTGENGQQFTGATVASDTESVQQGVVAINTVQPTINTPTGWKTYIHDDRTFGLAYPESWKLNLYVPPGFTRTSFLLEGVDEGCSIKVDKIGSEVPGEWLLSNPYLIGGYKAVAWENLSEERHILILSLDKNQAEIPKEHRFIFRITASSTKGRALCEQVLSTVKFFKQ